MHVNAGNKGRHTGLPDNHTGWSVGINRESSWTTVIAWWVSHPEHWKFCLAFTNLQQVSLPFSNIPAWHSDTPWCYRNPITTVGLCCCLHISGCECVLFSQIVSCSWTHFLNVMPAGQHKTPSNGLQDHSIRSIKRSSHKITNKTC